MHTSIKAELEKALLELKQIGKDRREIEADLGYRENYIDQVMSRGGNKKFLAVLRNYSATVLQKAIKGVQVESPISAESVKDKIILQLVESNRKLVDNTVDLTQMAKENWATANAVSRSEAYTPIDGPTVLRLLALVASRNRFRDKKEAELFLAAELDAMIAEEVSGQTADEAAQQQLRNAGANRGRQAVGTLTDAGR